MLINFIKITAPTAIALTFAVFIIIGSIPFITDGIRRSRRKCPKCGNKGMNSTSNGYYSVDHCKNNNCDYVNN